MADEAVKELKKFRVRVGSHAEEVGKDANGNPAVKFWGPGDVIATHVDLAKKFGAAKFERLNPGSDAVDLKKLNMTELQSIASDHEIDHTGMNKEAIIAAIKAVDPTL